jgi:dTDP-4-dehydrorhamnose reductase
MKSGTTILVTGADGQLGKELQVAAAAYPEFNFLFAVREELPIDDSTGINNYFNSHAIDFCINCAAYTAVDKAEIETEMGFLINATAVGNLATACKTANAGFIHISTDYVFDGTGTTPYKETDPTNPVSIYGQSKLKGEELALTNHPAAIIIRTSWVFSSFANNFVKTMLRLMKERESINVVNDQLGCPTYAADLANAILQIIQHYSSSDIKQQIFNYSNEGSISWYDFAVAIKELTKSKCIVNPIPGSQYPTPAKRPQYSVLDTTAIKNTFHLQIPHWKDSLQKCLALLI